MHARIQKVLSEGVRFDNNFFLVDEGIWSASETPFKWRLAGVPMMTQHSMLAWKLCDFSGDPDQYC